MYGGAGGWDARGKGRLKTLGLRLPRRFHQNYPQRARAQLGRLGACDGVLVRTTRTCPPVLAVTGSARPKQVVRVITAGKT